MLELHCHTTHSDGTLTPAQLVRMAVRVGVKALAITDHDTISGWDEAIATAPEDLEIVPGLELSTVCNGRSMHILGFYPDRQKLQSPLEQRLEGRKRRAELIVERLIELGYPIEVPEVATGTAPGRPHIAAALVKAGYVKSAQAAFNTLLGDDRPAFVQYDPFSANAGIELLLACDAVPVWAHPYLFRGGEIEAVLPELVEAGLMGVEVYHPNHTPTQEARLEALCQQYNLLMTGGSDFHGPPLGESLLNPCGLNRMHLDLSLLDPLKQAAEKLAARSTQVLPCST